MESKHINRLLQSYSNRIDSLKSHYKTTADQHLQSSILTSIIVYNRVVEDLKELLNK